MKFGIIINKNEIKVKTPKTKKHDLKKYFNIILLKNNF